MSMSLWLTPRENHSFTKVAQELISDEVPSNFSHKLEKHSFLPHVTLTSGVSPGTFEKDGKTAQQWLDALPIDCFRKEFDEVKLELDQVTAGEEFFRKVTIRLSPNDNLNKLASICRQETSTDSAEKEKAAKEYWPHMSLFYADIPKDEAQKKVPLIESQIGWALGSLFDCCGGTLCVGGDIVLVDTGKPVKEWVPIARRETPWAMWRMSRNLI